MEDIVYMLAQSAGYTFDEVVGPCRQSELSIVRQLIWKELRDCGMSYTDIGVLFNRGHRTVSYGVERVNDLIEIKEHLTIGLFNRINKCDAQN